MERACQRAEEPGHPPSDLASHLQQLADHAHGGVVAPGANRGHHAAGCAVRLQSGKHPDKQARGGAVVEWKASAARELLHSMSVHGRCIGNLQPRLPGPALVAWPLHSHLARHGRQVGQVWGAPLPAGQWRAPCCLAHSGLLPLPPLLWLLPLGQRRTSHRARQQAWHSQPAAKGCSVAAQPLLRRQARLAHGRRARRPHTAAPGGTCGGRRQRRPGRDTQHAVSYRSRAEGAMMLSKGAGGPQASGKGSVGMVARESRAARLERRCNGQLWAVGHEWASDPPTSGGVRAIPGQQGAFKALGRLPAPNYARTLRSYSFRLPRWRNRSTGRANSRPKTRCGACSARQRAG